MLLCRRYWHTRGCGRCAPVASDSAYIAAGRLALQQLLLLRALLLRACCCCQARSLRHAMLA